MKYLDFLRLYFDEAGDAETETSAGEADQTEDKVQSETGTDDKDEKKYSDSDLDAIIEKKFAKWKKQQEEAVDEATKLANMSAQERAEHERDSLQKELDELKAEKTKNEMERTARDLLKQEGINVSDSLIDSLIGKDADETNQRVKAFTESYKNDLQDGVKTALAHKTPEAGTDGSSVSHEDIRKEKNTHKRLEMYRESMGIKQ